MDSGVGAECLSCSRTSEASSIEALGPDGEWSCPHCNHPVGFLSDGEGIP